jgi:integrase
MATRRSYGSGSLFEHRGSWYGRWYDGPARVKRKLGPVRTPGERDGLTRAQAEKEMRRRMETEGPTVATHSRLTVEEAGTRMINHLETLGRKPTTLTVSRSLLRTHLSKHLASTTIDAIGRSDIERLMARMRRDGAGPKLIVNAITLLGQIFTFGQRRGWCTSNPCLQVDRPQPPDDTEIHHLDLDEVEALIAAVPGDDFGPTDRALYRTAAMAGLRQGELLALRWRDIDWPASRIRVRRNYVRGHWGTPKSKRSSRAVPMADELAGELDRHFKRSHYQGDDDLVFGDPARGTVLDHSYLVRRFKKALKEGKVREVRFNDLRHTFGTAMAAAGVPMRTLQEWMGHRDFKTTLIYADYAPSAQEAEMVARAFDRKAGPNSGPKLSETESNSGAPKPL